MIYSTGDGSRGYGDETDCMQEGFAYYWAASCTDSASNVSGFPSGWCGEWDAKGYVPPQYYSFLVENAKIYPDSILDTNDVAANSGIWAGVLWDIFQTFGKTIADSLILRSHELMVGTPDPVFQDGADMIIGADSSGYNWVHRYELFNIFCNRGIVPSCDCGVWGDVTGDGNINPVDVVCMVNYVYLQNDQRVQYANCPLEAGDANCDQAVNAVDVVLYVNRVYTGNNMFCSDPCLCNP